VILVIFLFVFFMKESHFKGRDLILTIGPDPNVKRAIAPSNSGRARGNNTRQASPGSGRSNR
jgi:hypothetical protein